MIYYSDQSSLEKECDEIVVGVVDTIIKIDKAFKDNNMTCWHDVCN